MRASVRIFATAAILIIAASPVSAQIGGVVIHVPDSLLEQGKVSILAVSPGYERVTVAGPDGRWRIQDYPAYSSIRVHAYAPGWVSHRFTIVASDTTVRMYLGPTATTSLLHAFPAAYAAGFVLLNATMSDGVVARESMAGARCISPDCAEVYARQNSPRTLYFWTRLSGGGASRYIDHVWYRDQQERARVRLPVGASAWRTWSSFTIPAGWVGEGRVEVVADNGVPLTERRFRFDPPEGRPAQPPISRTSILPGHAPRPRAAYDTTPVRPVTALVNHLLEVARTQRARDSIATNEGYVYNAAQLPLAGPKITRAASAGADHWAAYAIHADLPDIACSIWGGPFRRMTALGDVPLPAKKDVVLCYRRGKN